MSRLKLAIDQIVFAVTIRWACWIRRKPRTGSSTRQAASVASAGKSDTWPRLKTAWRF